MIQENEIIMFTLGVGINLFTLLHKHRLARIPASRILLFSYRLLLSAWAFTILEGFIFPTAFNFLEHLFYAASALAMAVWCWKISWGNNQGSRRCL